VDPALIVATERLGKPRGLGILQRRASHRRDQGEPSATCHLQPSPTENALCGYEWEGLTTIPRSQDWLEVPIELRCTDCGKVLASRVD
jgi:hypothetical protein